MLQTKCINHKYIQGVSRSKIQLKSTDRECHNQKYCQTLSHENVLPRVLLFKIHPGNDPIKYTAGECHKPIWLQGVSQSKDCHGISRQMSIKIERIAGNLTIKVLPGSATLLMTKGSITVKTTVIQNDRPGFSQFKGMSMRITIKTTAGECHNQN